MPLKNNFFFKFSLFALAVINTNFCVNKSFLNKEKPWINKAYYFSVNGDDSNDGSVRHPFKSISKLNTLPLAAGDAVYFNGGDTFKGSILIDSSKFGTAEKPISIGSYGNGMAVINSGNVSALTIYKSNNIKVSNLKFIGNGRKSGNTKEGVLVMESKNITIDNLDISGFQKSGLLIYSSKFVTNTHVYSYDNGSAGITVEGSNDKNDSREIYIGFCRAENNPGDPANLTNHSGNGIVVGHCTKVTIEYCEATNNGWDMPRIGNGPVGIWGYEADSLIIQHCLSYRNKTSVGGADGGGFDLDGGVTNSIVQYCLSYENQGSGYCIFQYWGASPWYNNAFRFNISIDDGLVSDSRAGVYVWNSSKDDKQFYNCDFYNNTIYNSKEAALSFSVTSQRKNFEFLNNIFVAKDSLIRGNKWNNSNDTFLANDWWSIKKKFNADGMNDFNEWITRNNIEQLNGKIIGLNVLPPFKTADDTTFTNVSEINSFDSYKMSGVSPVIQSGIGLHDLFHINTGNIDFNSMPINKNYLGACTHQ